MCFFIFSFPDEIQTPAVLLATDFVEGHCQVCCEQRWYQPALSSRFNATDWREIGQFLHCQVAAQ